MQQQIYDFINNWAKLYVKVKSGTTKNQSTPSHLFLSGSGGRDKSHLIHAIFHTVSKVFLYRSDDLIKPRVFLLLQQVLLQLISMVIQCIYVCINLAEVSFFL